MKCLSFKKIGALTSKPYAFLARPWELRSASSIDLFDSLGSNIRVDLRGGTILRIVPKVNERLNENWISDKVRFFYDALKRQRIIAPSIRSTENTFIKADWPSSFSFLGGLRSFNDSDFSLKSSVPSLLKKSYSLEMPFGRFTDFLSLLQGSNFSKNLNLEARIETPFGFKGSDFRLNYLFSTSPSQLTEMDSCFLLACNPRLESPLLNLRLRKGVISGSLRVYSLGFSFNALYNSLNVFNSTRSFLTFLEGRGSAPLLLKKTSKSSLIVGTSFILSNEMSSFLPSMVNLIRRHTSLSFSLLSNYVSFVGSMESGFCFSKHSVFSSLKNRFLVNWSLASDELVSPNKASYTIYQGHHGNLSLLSSDITLPSSSFFERNSIYLNFLGEPNKVSFLVKPPRQARTDWRVLKTFASFLIGGYKENFSSADLNRVLGKSIFTYSGYTPPLMKTGLLGLQLGFFSEFSFFMEDFYLNDSVTRSSVSMSLASSRFRSFKSNYFNKI